MTLIDFLTLIQYSSTPILQHSNTPWADVAWLAFQSCTENYFRQFLQKINPEPSGLGACRHKSERTHQGRLQTNFRRTEPSPRSCWLIWTTTKVQLLLDGSSNLFSCLQIKSRSNAYLMLFLLPVKLFFKCQESGARCQVSAKKCITFFIFLLDSEFLLLTSCF